MCILLKQHKQTSLVMTLSGLQDCLSFGKPLLIENIEEELDPVLDPVLERRYVKKGRGYTVALADKEVYQMGVLLFNKQRIRVALCVKRVAVILAPLSARLLLYPSFQAT